MCCACTQGCSGRLASDKGVIIGIEGQKVKAWEEACDDIPSGGVPFSVEDRCLFSKANRVLRNQLTSAIHV